MAPPLGSVLAIAAGASLGALLRWALASIYNPAHPQLPLGTLAANLIGGYLVGIAVAFFAQHPDVPPQWRLFVITGFLGGLTTFSTYSAEVVSHLQHGQFGWALLLAFSHLLGSFVLTAFGIGTYALLKG